MQIFRILFALWGEWIFTPDLMGQHKSRVTALINISQNTETQSKGSILSFLCCATMYGNIKLNLEISEMVDKQYISNVHFYMLSAAERQDEVKK